MGHAVSAEAVGRAARPAPARHRSPLRWVWPRRGWGTPVADVVRVMAGWQTPPPEGPRELADQAAEEECPEGQAEGRVVPGVAALGEVGRDRRRGRLPAGSG